jgi:hypothetical protein
MQITRRQSLGLLGSALAAPYLLRGDPAKAAVTFTKVGPILQLGSATPNAQERTRLAAFYDGSFLATWTNFGSGTNVTCRGQYFSRDGAALTGIIDFGTEAGLEPPTAWSFPVSFPNGRAHVYFTSKRTGAPSGEAEQLFLQRMSAGRTKLGPPKRINGNPDTSASVQVATRLSNGNVMVLWQSGRAGGTTDSIDAFCRVVAPDGTPVTPERRATAHVNRIQVPKSVAALSNGRSVFIYDHIDYFVDGTYRVFLQQLDANGQRVGNPVLQKTADALEPHGSGGVEATTPNRFVALHTRRHQAGGGMARAEGAPVKVWGAEQGWNDSVPPEQFAGTYPINSDSQSNLLIIASVFVPNIHVVLGLEPAEGPKKLAVLTGDASRRRAFSAPTILRQSTNPIFFPEDAVRLNGNRLAVAYTESNSSGFDLTAKVGFWDVSAT